jgi:hypothetical protein
LNRHQDFSWSAAVAIRQMPNLHILHDRSHTPAGLPLAATSAAISAQRCFGLMAAVERAIRSTAQLSKNCENGVFLR